MDGIASELGNDGKGKLTVERLRQFKGFASMTEAEALKVIRTLEIFAALTFKLYKLLKFKPR
jgi:hypothetical protein